MRKGLFYAEKTFFLGIKAVLMQSTVIIHTTLPLLHTSHIHLLTSVSRWPLCIVYVHPCSYSTLLIKGIWQYGLVKDQLFFFLLKSNIINSACLNSLLNVNAMYLFKSFVTKPLTHTHVCLKLKWLLVTKFKHLIAKIIFKYHAY